MTRKDYELIARNINRMVKIAIDEEGILQVMAENMADELEQNNPRFDREKFLKACGI